MGNAPGSPAGGASNGLIARHETGVILTCGDSKLEPMHKGRATYEGGGQGGYAPLLRDFVLEYLARALLPSKMHLLPMMPASLFEFFEWLH
jgi:hypothetical protein